MTCCRRRSPPTGTLLALGDYDAVTHFWTYPVPSASTPETGAQIIVDPVRYQTVNGLAFSPNGSYLAIAAGYPGELSIWNVASRSVISRLSIPDDQRAVGGLLPERQRRRRGRKGLRQDPALHRVSAIPAVRRRRERCVRFWASVDGGAGAK